MCQVDTRRRICHSIDIHSSKCSLILQFVCTGDPGEGGPDLHFTVMDHDTVRSDAILLRWVFLTYAGLFSWVMVCLIVSLLHMQIYCEDPLDRDRILSLANLILYVW